MSERGSFVTSYIYCGKCLEHAKRLLLCREKELCSCLIPGWGSDEFLPIIAGKVGSTWAGGELYWFESYLIPALEEVVCCPLSIAVIPDGAPGLVLSVTPKAKQ